MKTNWSTTWGGISSLKSKEAGASLSKTNGVPITMRASMVSAKRDTVAKMYTKGRLRRAAESGERPGSIVLRNYHEDLMKQDKPSSIRNLTRITF